MAIASAIRIEFTKVLFILFEKQFSAVKPQFEIGTGHPSSRTHITINCEHTTNYNYVFPCMFTHWI